MEDHVTFVIKGMLLTAGAGGLVRRNVMDLAGMEFTVKNNSRNLGGRFVRPKATTGWLRSPECARKRRSGLRQQALRDDYCGCGCESEPAMRFASRQGLLLCMHRILDSRSKHGLRSYTATQASCPPDEMRYKKAHTATLR